MQTRCDSTGGPPEAFFSCPVPGLFKIVLSNTPFSQNKLQADTQFLTFPAYQLNVANV